MSMNAASAAVMRTAAPMPAPIPIFAAVLRLVAEDDEEVEVVLAFVGNGVVAVEVMYLPSVAVRE